MRSDILFLESSGFFSAIIKLFTRSMITHVAIKVGSTCYHSEIPGGVQKSPVGDVLSRYNLIDSIQVDIPSIEDVEKHVGKPYDILTLPLAWVGQITGRKFFSGDAAFICSEYVTKVIFGKPYALTPVVLYDTLVHGEPIKGESLCA